MIHINQALNIKLQMTLSNMKSNQQWALQHPTTQKTKENEDNEFSFINW